MNTASVTLAIVSSGAAVLMSGWMLRQTAGIGGLPGCSAGSACDAATKSRWARLGSLPVAGLGLSAYIVLFSLVWAYHLHLWRSSEWITIHILRTTAIAVIAAAVWFTAIQLVLLRRLCAYCTATHVLAIAAGISSVIALGSSSAVTLDGMLALAAVLTLIALQVFIPPKAYKLTSASPLKAADPSLPPAQASTTPASTDQLPMPILRINAALRPSAAIQRNIRLFGNRITLNIRNWPLLGSPDAPEVLALLMDFTCKECHHLHRLIYQAVERYAGRVAFFIVPVPFHRDCNSAVTCHKPEQVYACAFARLAWAIWLVNPASYAEWDYFMAESTELQPYGLALEQAHALCDIRKYELHEVDAVLDARIAEGVKIAQILGALKVPALVLGSGVLRGHVHDIDDLIQLLEPRLDKAKPSTNPRCLR